ncbi:ROK family glucokinase [Lentibacillus sp. Marseille-P4043]|uniref:ROK family glucokinase n=1 Tax=Lentibacillus sp. Marseille-P4043 TaxID=2040293 RepID=UPI000D0BC2BE|nr:ROK family glucokinase [Lentibacillus sp. Marseille-P4043]
MEDLIIGLDIGGTSTKAGLLNVSGEVIHKWEIPTDKKDHGSRIVEYIWESITEALKELQIENQILGIGVGAPGFVDKETGMVYEAVNIGWKNFDLGNRLKNLSNLPVFIENDANLAALGENKKGSGSNAKDLIAITLGTGVGSGIIANGEILSGMNGTAAEIGHIIADPNGYPCNCGRTGCLDTIASATGIVHQAMDYITENPDSPLALYYRMHGALDARDVFELAREGDKASEHIIDHTTDVLGFMVASAATIINPSTIIVGGGLSKAGNLLLSKITHYFRKYALPRISENCEIKLAQLGNDAGMIGAAYLVKSGLNQVLA